VLVQLGGELVTDVEQAILECVKNSYDADSPGCRIEIDTRAEQILIETGPYSKFRGHTFNTDTVAVEIRRANDQEAADLATLMPDDIVERRLTCSGRITIVDRGAGIPPSGIRNSWLMISGSIKRTDGEGPKRKTLGGRTPLGDKGLGRLGTMKLGDVLLVESSVSPEEDIASAQFRWKDCETAESVDEVPVTSLVRTNVERLKGTRVSVFGLADLNDWRRHGRIDQLAQSLARLVSPFEATTTFPVTLTLDGSEHSLMAVTNQVLSQAVAEFRFSWHRNAAGKMMLIQTARFKKALFGESRTGDGKAKYDLAFGEDNGVEFLEYLNSYSRTKPFEKRRVGEPWLVEFKSERSWESLLPDDPQSVSDPGAFDGSFYFFHLDAPQENAVSGIAINRKLIKQMSGISILRDGFQVRSPMDWLGLATAMTTGSSYHMRVSNTIGYFSLSGEHNYLLTEKSDREGFVENSAYRGFYAIAKECKKFSNTALEGLRRALDSFYAMKRVPEKDGVRLTAESSVDEVAGALTALRQFQDAADGAVDVLNAKVLGLEGASAESIATGSQDALATVKEVVGQISKLHAAVRSEVASDAFDMLRHERNAHKEQLLTMVESAAIGLSARGLAHELRTHLGEIRYRLTQITKASGASSSSTIGKHVNAIRSSCSAIMSAASLIDPLLPRSRATRDEFTVESFVREYVEHRQAMYERESVTVDVRGMGVAPLLFANKARMLQVLDNLMRNSIYWLRRSEQSSGADFDKRIVIEGTPVGYIVSDSGLGVDPQYEHSLFEMFVSGKPDGDGGQGLGLFICKQLLQADGCDLELLHQKNPVGRRYKFEVNLSNVKR